VDEMCQVVKPFHVLTERLCAEKYPTLSMVLPAIGHLEKNLAANKSDFATVSSLKKEIKKAMEMYLQK
jgi:hypothetical protein